MGDLVVVDIGGTHARFAIASIAGDGSIILGPPVTLRTADHASFDDAWDAFRALKGGRLPPAVSMAIAGQVGSPGNRPEIIRFTNNAWTIRPDCLPSLGAERITLVNDFAAVAHAVVRVVEGDLVHLAGPDQPLGRQGTISVIGPGTGLGAAHLWRSGREYRVQPTEGGHIDFAPLDPFEDALRTRLRGRHARVSVERVVSGPAIVDIYQTLATLEGRNVTELDDVTIWTRAATREDSLAVAAMERFCLMLGSVAGDLALAQGGFAGVVIAGGLGYRMRDALRSSGFAARFTAKGRFESLMATIPVKLLVHPQPGLLGAAAAFVAEHGTV